MKLLKYKGYIILGASSKITDSKPFKTCTNTVKEYFFNLGKLINEFIVVVLVYVQRRDELYEFK